METGDFGEDHVMNVVMEDGAETLVRLLARVPSKKAAMLVATSAATWDTAYVERAKDTRSIRSACRRAHQGRQPVLEHTRAADYRASPESARGLGLTSTTGRRLESEVGSTCEDLLGLHMRRSAGLTRPSGESVRQKLPYAAPVHDLVRAIHAVVDQEYERHTGVP